jgi:CO/xanthine dehydrogenase FAD-binding subunit
VDLVRPADIEEALAARAARPEALALRGGTDVMVELNLDRARPPALLDLARVRALEGWEDDGGGVRLGAALTHAQVVAELRDRLPAVAVAARATGSAQIRNRATVGGNVGTASPSGDVLCALLAAGAEVELASVRGRRRLGLDAFVTGPKQTARAPDELIWAFHVPVAAGPQAYAKVAARNAMVMGTVALGLCLDAARRTVAVAAGGAAPTPVRAPAAEAFAAAALDWNGRAPLEDGVAARFAQLVLAATDPQDDVRGTAAYRRHALQVLARRCLHWTWEEHRCA